MGRRTNETLHEMTDLDTVNVVLHRQANNIWTKKGDNFNGKTIDKFILDRDRTYNMTYKDMFQDMSYYRTHFTDRDSRLQWGRLSPQSLFIESGVGQSLPSVG